MNGETWNLNQKLPRVSKKIIDPEKKQMTEIVKKQLGKILESKRYDLLAIQELVYFTSYFSQIKSEIYSENNRIMTRNLKTKDDEITLFNIHINTWSEDNETVRKEVLYDMLNKCKVSKFIILGDFNAYTKEQDTSEKSMVSEGNIIHQFPYHR